MYPASKEFMDAELAYRRERLIAARSGKRLWRRRGRRTTRTRPAVQHGQAVTAA